MGSLNAQRAAQKVSETIRKGQLVKIGKVLKEVGYSEGTSKRPQSVIGTKAFTRALEVERRPLQDLLAKEISRLMIAMSEKNLKHEEYRVLAGSLDILVRNQQLLNGGATDRHVFVLPSEVMERNDIATNHGSTEPQ